MVRTLSGIGLLFLTAGCGAIGRGWIGNEDAGGWYSVELVIDEDEVLLVNAESTTAAQPAGRISGAVLTWELRGSHAQLLAAGEASDPRLAFGEWMAGGEMRGGRVYAGVGLLSLRLPAIAGTLVVFEGEASSRREVGRLRFVPRAVSGRLAQGLLSRPEDVLGEPVRVAGWAPQDAALDILFLPEGYTLDEQSLFRADVATLVSELQQQPDIGAFWPRINIWRQDVASRESGIDDPDTNTERDTAFDVSLGTGDSRLVYPQTWEAHQALAMLRWQAGVDVIALIANSTEWAGAGGTISVITRHSSGGLILTHELGHSVFGLHDEYSAGECQNHVNGPNVTDTLVIEDLPWADLVTTTSLPTPDDDRHTTDVGAFEGAYYCLRDMYRPQRKCLMRAIGPPMCRVCRREMERYFEKLAALPSGPQDDGDSDAAGGDPF